MSATSHDPVLCRLCGGSFKPCRCGERCFRNPTYTPVPVVCAGCALSASKAREAMAADRHVVEPLAVTIYESETKTMDHRDPWECVYFGSKDIYRARARRMIERLAALGVVLTTRPL
jgi:hypothetical protein